MTDIRSEVHSWLWAMGGTCCLSKPICENQLEKKSGKQLLFVCLSDLPSKGSAFPAAKMAYSACDLTREARALRHLKGCTLISREYARHGARGFRAIVEERRRPAEAEHPPAEYLRCAAGEDSERRRCGRVRRERPDSGAFVDAAERRAEHLVPGTTVSLGDHERMNHRDQGETRAGGGVANRGPTAIGVPAEDAVVGKAEAPHFVRTLCEFHAPRRHLEDVRSARGIEHVRPLQETRERLAILTVADEAEAAGRRDLARKAAYVAAPAAKREVQWQACHVNASDHEFAPTSSSERVSPDARVVRVERRGRIVRHDAPPRETFPPVTLGHIRGHGCRELLVYCQSLWCNRGTAALIFPELK